MQSAGYGVRELIGVELGVGIAVDMLLDTGAYARVEESTTCQLMINSFRAFHTLLS